MNSNTIFEGIASLFQWTFQVFDVTNNYFNMAVIVLGFFGLFYWLIQQKKFNAAAESNPDQRK